MRSEQLGLPAVSLDGGFSAALRDVIVPKLLLRAALPSYYVRISSLLNSHPFLL